MTPRKKLKETPAQARSRHTATLTRAWEHVLPGTPMAARCNAEWDYKKVRAAVRAAVPGRQQARNLTAVMDAAVRATARVIRRTLTAK